jgi:hypothetical protein
MPTRDTDGRPRFLEGLANLLHEPITGRLQTTGFAVCSMVASQWEEPQHCLPAFISKITSHHRELREPAPENG